MSVDRVLAEALLARGFLHQRAIESDRPEVVRASRGVVSGRYELLDRLGRGGQGEVFRATDRSMARTVAVKRLVVAPDDDRARASLDREVRALVDLHHEGIPAVYDLVWESDAVSIVMELVQGESLESSLERRGCYATSEAVEVVAQLALTVGYLHEHGYVHRDIKPANVLIQSDGRVRLVDFGLAKSEAGASRLTKAGMLIGTPAFMSPEQAAGKTAEIDARTDVYALGVLLWTLLVGRPPFDGDSLIEVIVKVGASSPPPLRQVNANVPQRLERLVLRATAPQRDQRFPNGNELARALLELHSRVASARLETSKPPAAPTGGPRRVNRTSVAVGGLVVLGLAGGVAMALAVSRSSEPSLPPRDRATSVPPPPDAPTPPAPAVQSGPAMTDPGPALPDDLARVSSRTEEPTAPEPPRTPVAPPAPEAPVEVAPSPAVPPPVPVAASPRHDVVDEALDELERWDRSRPLDRLGALDTAPLASAVAPVERALSSLPPTRREEATRVLAMRFRLEGRPSRALQVLDSFRPSEGRSLSLASRTERALLVFQRTFPDAALGGPEWGGYELEGVYGRAHAAVLRPPIDASETGAQLALLLVKVLEVAHRTTSRFVASAAKPLEPPRPPHFPARSEYSKDLAELSDLAKAVAAADPEHEGIARIVLAQLYAQNRWWEDAHNEAHRACAKRPRDPVALALKALADAGPNLGVPCRSGLARLEGLAQTDLAAAFALDAACPVAVFVAHRVLGNHYGAITGPIGQDLSGLRHRASRAGELRTRFKVASEAAPEESTSRVAYAAVLVEHAADGEATPKDVVAELDVAKKILTPLHGSDPSSSWALALRVAAHGAYALAQSQDTKDYDFVKTVELFEALNKSQPLAAWANLRMGEFRARLPELGTFRNKDQRWKELTRKSAHTHWETAVTVDPAPALREEIEARKKAHGVP